MEKLDKKTRLRQKEQFSESVIIVACEHKNQEIKATKCKNCLKDLK